MASEEFIDSKVSSRPSLPNSFRSWLRLWFLLSDPVDRKAYVTSGVGLMFVKYVVEATTIYLLTQLFYTPLDFINPSISARAIFLHGAPEWLGLAWVFWTLPFLWIATAMSVRRAFDAGISPWNGLWVLAPLFNLVIMLMLATLSSSTKPASYWDPAQERLEPYQAAELTASLRAAIGSLAIGAIYAFVTILFSIYALNSYGAALFFGTPFITGVAAGYLFNRDAERSQTGTISVALVAVLLCGVGMLLFGVEGLGCLVMAAPIIAPLGALGAPLGKFLASKHRRSQSQLVGALLVIPLLATIETRLPNETQYCVVSTVDIKASPEKVWQQVISFPEITAPPAWYFRMGISCPMGACIHGSGAGAVRECIFTTGRFIEPITAWEPPIHLAFDVREQPEPMFELTPYRDLHPPHPPTRARSYPAAFRIRAGQFRRQHDACCWQLKPLNIEKCDAAKIALDPISAPAYSPPTTTKERQPQGQVVVCRPPPGVRPATNQITLTAKEGNELS